MSQPGSVLTITFVLIVLVELCCGLVATIWTAFFYDKVRSVYWGYGILGVYLAFFSVVFHHMGREIWCAHAHSKDNQARKKLAKISWLCWITTFVTFGIFGVLYSYDTIALRQPALNVVVRVAFVVYLLTVLLLTAISCSYLCDYLCPRGTGRSYLGQADEDQFSEQGYNERKLKG
ncbi:unnamed protein product [Orchesella dallaii]|uniref:MARVEL domain-containing protein n=1 Tax=Orchesella dallaii TaxID=48710 RepID=A0ABP1RVS2_9HEXA